ncbi:MAG: phage tail tube protein [Pseudomonadota bacterium]
MTDATTIRGDQILIKVGDGADPEQFAHPCLINTTRSISFTAEGNAVQIPDCDNPSDPAWTRFIKSTLSATVSGAGTLHVPNVADYFAWLQSPDSKNVQVVVGDLANTIGGHFAGKFALTQFTPADGDRGGLASCTIAMQSDGRVQWVAAT